MTVKVRDSTGTLRTVNRIRVMDGGVLRTIRSVKVEDSLGVLRTVYTSMAVTSNFSTFSAVGSNEPVLSTPTCVVSVTGGAAPLTYAWTSSVISGAGSATATAPTSSTTIFSATGLMPYSPLVVAFTCTVTDNASVVATVTVTVTFTLVGFL
jgi:hypothetical protein